MKCQDNIGNDEFFPRLTEKNIEVLKTLDMFFLLTFSGELKH